jgi:hypothetical protein
MYDRNRVREAAVDIEIEMRHLERADRDIARSGELISTQEEICQRIENNGNDGIEEARRLLENLRESRSAMTRHRDLIVETLAILRQWSRQERPLQN